jgi:hypothetical protein
MDVAEVHVHPKMGWVGGRVGGVQGDRTRYSAAEEAY